MKSEFVLEIDPQEWQGAFEALDRYFETDRDLMQAIDVLDTGTLHDYREGEVGGVYTVTAESVLNILNDSEPAITLEGKPEDNREIFKMKGLKADADDVLQEFLFGSYTHSDLADISGASKKSAGHYKCAMTSPPVELFDHCFERTKKAFEMEFKPEGDVYPIGVYSSITSPAHNRSSSGKPVVENAGQEELRDINRAVKGLERLEKNNPEAYGGVVNNPDAVSELVELEADPYTSTINMSEFSTSSSPFFSAISELGVVERWGENSAYQLKASEAYLKALQHMVT